MLSAQFDTDDGTVIKRGGYDVRKLDNNFVVSLSDNRKFSKKLNIQWNNPKPKTLSTMEKFEHTPEIPT
jgi:hypothetical protein